MGLQGLLTLSIILSVLVGVQLLYQGQLAADFWQESATLYDTSARPLRFGPGCNPSAPFWQS